MAETTLESVRQDVADRLTAGGVPAYASVPERVTPPAAVVLPDTPYVDGEGATMCGEWRVRLRVVLLGERGTNAVAAAGLDALIVSAATVLADELVSVAEPAEVELNGAGYLGTVLSLETISTLEALP